ncbi:MAG: hypothetical protein WDA22_14250 [Bacteroidota bacterium]
MPSKITSFRDFLLPREERFKPDDAAINGLKRIDKIDFSGAIYLSEKTSNTDMILIKKGDLVISGINVAKGAVAIYEGDEDITATIHYSSYSYDEQQINKDYLKWFLKSAAFINLIKAKIPGGIKTEIKPKHFLPLEILLPGLNSQKQIVNKILETELEYKQLQIEIENQQQFLKQLRQQILQDAIQGKLVSHNPNAEPATNLLARIKEEKQKLLSAGEIKKEKPLPLIKPEEIPFDLPKGWMWCRLGEVIDLISGQHIEVQDYNLKGEGNPYLTGPSDFGEIHPKFSKWSTKPKVIAMKNDILITVKGSGVGKTNILHEDNIAISRQLMAVRNMGVNLKFLNFYLQTKFEQFQSQKDGLIPGINRDTVLLKCFPLPPFTEQKRITDAIEKIMQFSAQLDNQITSSETLSKQLKNVVLRDAFESKKNYKNPPLGYQIAAEPKVKYKSSNA